MTTDKLYSLIVIQVLAHLQAQLQRHAGPEDLRASIGCSLIPAKLIAGLFIKYKKMYHSETYKIFLNPYLIEPLSHGTQSRRRTP